jgi:hypothetical protein
MTQGGQRDPVDPSLIVESSRVSLPSKRVRGVDYPETVGNTGVVLNSRKTQVLQKVSRYLITYTNSRESPASSP